MTVLVSGGRKKWQWSEITGMIWDFYFSVSRQISALVSFCFKHPAVLSLKIQQIFESKSNPPLFSNKALQPAGFIFLQSNRDGFQVFGFKLHMVGHLQLRNDVNLTQEDGSSVSSIGLIPSFTLCKQQIHELSRLRISPLKFFIVLCMWGGAFFPRKQQEVSCGSFIKSSQT